MTELARLQERLVQLQQAPSDAVVSFKDFGAPTGPDYNSYATTFLSIIVLLSSYNMTMQQHARVAQHNRHNTQL
eukprot:4605504-Pyramimonas_sp.AAC.2